jgi:hypothetical protein
MGSQTDHEHGECKSHRRMVGGGFRFTPLTSDDDVECRTIEDGRSAYFFILRALPSNVVTIACINPSCVM